MHTRVEQYIYIYNFTFSLKMWHWGLYQTYSLKSFLPHGEFTLHLRILLVKKVYLQNWILHLAILIIFVWIDQHHLLFLPGQVAGCSPGKGPAISRISLSKRGVNLTGQQDSGLHGAERSWLYYVDDLFSTEVSWTAWCFTCKAMVSLYSSTIRFCYVVQCQIRGGVILLWPHSSLTCFISAFKCNNIGQ